MVLYSKFAHGFQFLGEKNNLIIRYLVVEILSKLGGTYFLIHPVSFYPFLVYRSKDVRAFSRSENWGNAPNWGQMANLLRNFGFSHKKSGDLANRCM